MSKLTTSYNTCTIESSLSKKDLDTAAAYAPGADTLKDEKENPLFRVSFGKDGSVGQYGVKFNAIKDGKMFFSFNDASMPENATDRKSYLQDKLGSVLFALNAVEQQITAALASRAGEIAAVSDSITIG